MTGAKAKAALHLGSGISEYPTPDAGNIGSEEQALGDYDLIPITSESITENIDLDGQPTINEQNGLSGEDILGINVSGNVSLEGHYEGLDQLLAAALGSKTLTNLTGDEYKHIYTPSRYLSQSDDTIRRFTLGIDKNVSIFVFRACMVNSIDFTYTISNGLDITADIVCCDVTRNSTKNTASDSWSYNPTYSNELILGQKADFEIDSTSVTINEFNLTIDNNLDTYKTIQSGKYLAEPVREDGIVSVTGSFNFPKYENDNYFSDLYSEETMDLELTFTGSNMGTNDKKFIINIPYAKILNPKAPLNGAGKIPKNVEFKGYKGDSLNSAVQITTQNYYPYNRLT